MRITVDRERCIGAGQCVLTEPRVFDQSDDDGRVLLLTDGDGPQTEAAVRRAVQFCPSRALGLSEG
jgi:ferredoxin